MSTPGLGNAAKSLAPGKCDTHRLRRGCTAPGRPVLGQLVPKEDDIGLQDATAGGTGGHHKAGPSSSQLHIPVRPAYWDIHIPIRPPHDCLLSWLQTDPKGHACTACPAGVPCMPPMPVLHACRHCLHLSPPPPPPPQAALHACRQPASRSSLLNGWARQAQTDACV